MDDTISTIVATVIAGIALKLFENWLEGRPKRRRVGRASKTTPSAARLRGFLFALILSLALTGI